MQLLERMHLLQFFLFEAQTLHFDRTSAIIAPNGAGKSALLDALQIVLLGGDRRYIHFNAQAGGKARSRSIRDYCLGVYRSGDEGRKRRTATTYISLVFRDQDSGLPLTAGIALGASADEPEHRQHGLYLLPGVALDLEDHVERIDGRELPLEWSRFRALAGQRCREAGTSPEFHASGERFVRDLLTRLRASPGAHPDFNAFRKAFQNALNLQRVEDVDLFVRTLVAEDRPTDVARFRALLDSFRQIKERIEQLQHRIDSADRVDGQYARISAQAVRAASYRALAAEYQRDLLGEQVETAQDACDGAAEALASLGRDLAAARAGRGQLRDEHAHALALLQGREGYGEQAQLDELAGRDRDRLQQLKTALLREIAAVRERYRDTGRLGLPGVDATALANAGAPWEAWHEALVALPGDAALPWTPAQLHAQAKAALAAAAPLVDAVDGHARGRHAAFEQARDRLESARHNLKRLAAGQAELHPDAVRLMNYLRDEGIVAQPVCDLVRVVDAAWQPAIEAYLRSNVEALLVPAQDEERAVKLYRSLRDGRAVYGVKLALASQARGARGATPDAGSVAALLVGDNADALAFLRRQLGELRCVETEAELVHSRQALARDGLLAKGGSIERLRLPAAADLRIGASSSRERARALREDVEAAEADLRRIEPELRRAEACQRGMARLAEPEELAQALHARVLEHEQVESHYRSGQDSREAARDPDLLRMSERVAALKQALDAGESRVEGLISAEALAQSALAQQQALLAALQAQAEIAARRAVEAFRDGDVDANLVERHREELEQKQMGLEDCAALCDKRARDNADQLQKLLPEAWSALQQYASTHGVDIGFEASQWREARRLLQGELTRLRDTELVNYQAEARQAYDTAVETFRSNVANTLHDNFVRLKTQIDALNRTLRNSPAFSNNERYRFHYEVLPDYRDLHRFIGRIADLGGEDNLFGSAGEVPAAFAELVDESASARAIDSPLDDYRRFFQFGVQIRQDEHVIGTLSERMRSGSGGEHRAPLYVIAGAALAAAYGKSEAHPGGLGLILLDEFGDKIDAQNARATTNYLRSLGLQLVLAAPDTAQGTLSGVLDSYIELFRDEDLLQAERIEVRPEARELLLSDQFDLHPELLAEETARIAGQQAPT
ncbi:SbcC/MukB-like Walker B domain-containing protein [Luteimonas sp. MC1750]|uniref:SbcC/MukB-like Walker B domain-containing protein n=1 Tax=Luteimonas sp. MC1750 TaxID=2799326 RepID=UPI0018F0E3D0|nr:SbcC/MukB-like Walker B domain-containing protein [Luteimonas sp. MC1750]MBJ6983744.1 AAA family ATPase [Luteimonas sp. MC1750]QQO06578.1 AAA family ATPase [Luteimonas sp. MC1750]